MTLAEFLLARIAEDAAAATERTFTPDMGPPYAEEVFTSGGRIYADSHHTVDITESYSRWAESLPLSNRAHRVLAECEAKRRIVERAEHDQRAFGSELARSILRDLALPYADHSDYRDEWRP